MFGTTNPADGSPLEPVTETPVDTIAEIVERAREAQRGWAKREFDDRADAIRQLGRRVLERRKEILEILGQEMGRTSVDNLMSEVVGVMPFIETAIKLARESLSPEKVALSKLDWPGKQAVIEAVPRGVVGIIAPWNYPLANFFKHMFPALLAGNALVLKPSEYTPRTGAWLAALCNDVLGAGLVGLVQGGGPQGSGLIDSGVDAITFTGSVATGRKVSGAAGEKLLPCTVELGGKDAAIVLADCDLDRTVAGIAQWSLFNAGQDCSSVERVYLEESISEIFVKRLGAYVKTLEVPGDVGPVQNEAQLEKIERHIADAKEKGAVVVCGGERTGSGFGFQPTLVNKCTEDMLILEEETFGPVIAICIVKDAEQALRQANSASYGLCASVWTKNLKRGENLARRLEAGVCFVNNHSIAGTLPQIPWTGVKNTGPGVANSRHAYATYVRRRTIFIDSGKNPDPFWKPSSPELEEFGEAIVARGLGSFSVIFKLAGLVGKRVKSIKERVTAGS